MHSTGLHHIATPSETADAPLVRYLCPANSVTDLSDKVPATALERTRKGLRLLQSLLQFLVTYPLAQLFLQTGGGLITQSRTDLFDVFLS